jgi:hypothetical protein
MNPSFWDFSCDFLGFDHFSFWLFVFRYGSTFFHIFGFSFLAVDWVFLRYLLAFIRRYLPP